MERRETDGGEMEGKLRVRTNLKDNNSVTELLRGVSVEGKIFI